MVTIRVKENSKQAKAFIELVKTFDFVEFLETGLSKPQPVKKAVKDNYNPKFVAKVLKSFNNDKRTVIKTADLWQSI